MACEIETNSMLVVGPGVGFLKPEKKKIERYDQLNGAGDCDFRSVGAFDHFHLLPSHADCRGAVSYNTHFRAIASALGRCSAFFWLLKRSLHLIADAVARPSNGQTSQRFPTVGAHKEGGGFLLKAGNQEKKKPSEERIAWFVENHIYFLR